MISFLLYEPQALQMRWGTIRALHLLHFTRVGCAIFQFARRLSRRLLEDLFFGHIAIMHLLGGCFTPYFSHYTQGQGACQGFSPILYKIKTLQKGIPF
jgi:hypothetical protein